MNLNINRSWTLKFAYEFQKKLLIMPQVEEIILAISTFILKWVKIV